MTPFDRRCAAAIFLTFACFYLFTSGGHFYASDDLQKLQVLDSLWYEHDFTIKIGWGRGTHARFSWFPLGATFAMVPGWGLGHLVVKLFPMLPAEYVVRFAVSLQNSVVTAALLAVAFLFARRLGASVRGGLWMTVALGLGTMLWPYAKTSWSEPTAALLALGGLWAAWEGDRASDASRRRLWLAAGLLLGVGTSIREELALVVLGVAAWLGVRHRHDRAAIAGSFGLPLAAAASVALWYNNLRYGMPFDFRSYRLPQKYLIMEEGRFGWSLKNVYQYLVSPNQGIVWYSPAVLLGLAGLRQLPRTAQGLLASALVPLWVFYVFGWGLSSWAWGLRYNYVFVPFLLLGAAFVRPTTVRRRAIAAAVLGLGVAVQLLAVTLNYNGLYKDELIAHRPERLTIQRLMTTASHAPLKLAVQALPTALSNGVALVLDAGHVVSVAPARPPAESVLEYRARRDHLPDYWFVLQLLSPLPRKLTLLAALLLAIATAASALWLARVWRAAPADESAECGRLMNTESTEKHGDPGEVLTQVGHESKRD